MRRSLEVAHISLQLEIIGAWHGVWVARLLGTWHGVCTGVALSLLQTVGQPQLAMDSLRAFEDMATELTTDVLRPMTAWASALR